MRVILFLICLTIPLMGCYPSRSEGRAAGILDAAKPEAEAHRDALVSGDIEASQETGLRLLTVLSCWWSDCAE
ncbi:MAG: hypothetical protein AAFQ58_19265 [Pseudomonadota bacterium]